jgi:hypothetical protein
MAENNFWEEGDVTLMKAWVNDLVKLGYKFPAVRRGSQHSAQHGARSMLTATPQHTTPRHW